jgi:ABC-type Fe3+-siderophore transport system permease subunit
MKNYNRHFIFSTILLSLLILQGCDLIVDIFSAGFWVGIVIAVLVVTLIIWLIVKGLKKMG